MVVTERAYKEMETEWNDAKKYLDLSVRLTNKALSLLTDIFNEETATHNKLSHLVTYRRAVQFPNPNPNSSSDRDSDRVGRQDQKGNLRLDDHHCYVL